MLDICQNCRTLDYRKASLGYTMINWLPSRRVLHPVLETIGQWNCLAYCPPCNLQSDI